MKAVEGSTAFFLEKILESQDHDPLPQIIKMDFQNISLKDFYAIMFEIERLT